MLDVSKEVFVDGNPNRKTYMRIKKINLENFNIKNLFVKFVWNKWQSFSRDFPSDFICIAKNKAATQNKIVIHLHF